AAATRKWEPALQQAILEYHGATRRIKDIASGDIPRALVVLDRIIDALEAYLRLAPPTGVPEPAPLERIAEALFVEEPPPPAAAAEAAPANPPESPDLPEPPA